MNRPFFISLVFISALMLPACQPVPDTGLPSPTQPTVTDPPAITETLDTTISELTLVVFDDDGSPDGTSALLYFLADPKTYVVSASISFGEAYPANYIQHIGRILDSFNITDIPLGAGDSAPLSGSNQFPDWIHDAADGFWGLPLPNADKTYPASDAAQLMVSTIRKSPQPVIVFLSGPCTNFAQALRQDPEIKSNIQAVFIMGGAVHVRGNIDDLVADPVNTTAEWNIYADPLAAKEVLESGLDVYLVPLDATNQVKISSADLAEWYKGSDISDLAALIYERLMASIEQSEFMIWDLMTAAIAVNPDLCTFESLGLDVIVDTGVNSGQVVINANAATKTNVCLAPEVDSIRQTLIDVFSLN